MVLLGFIILVIVAVVLYNKNPEIRKWWDGTP